MFVDPYCMATSFKYRVEGEHLEMRGSILRWSGHSIGQLGSVPFLAQLYALSGVLTFVVVGCALSVVPPDTHLTHANGSVTGVLHANAIF